MLRERYFYDKQRIEGFKNEFIRYFRRILTQSSHKKILSSVEICNLVIYSTVHLIL